MNEYPAPGAIVCIGPEYVGRVLTRAGPNTVSLIFADGSLMNAHISVLEYHKGPIMARPKLTDEQKAEKAREKEAAKAAGAAPKSKLFDAVKFCVPGFKEGAEAYSVHASLYGGWITTYNGVLQFGHPIEEPLQCFPHFGQLLSALKSTDGQQSSITQIDAGRLSIKAGKFRTVIDCVTDPALVMRHAPDTVAGAIDARMRKGFEIMKQVASKSGEHVVTASILLRNNSMVATDRRLIVEYWHALPFPTLTVPAEFVEAVLKVPKALQAFGFSERSLTFYYDDWSFIRTQLYSEEWPDVDKVLPYDFSKALQIPDAFFESLAKVAPFCKRDFVLFNDNEIRTNDEDDVGCVVEVPGLQQAWNGIDCERLLRMAGRITHFDYLSDPSLVAFRGDMLRGASTCFIFEGAASREASIPAPAPAPVAPSGQAQAAPPPLPSPPPLRYAEDPPIAINPGGAFMPDPAATWLPPEPIGDDTIEGEDEDIEYNPEPSAAAPSGFGPPQR